MTALEEDFKLDCLKVARLVFCASSFAGLGCSYGDLLIDLVVGEEAFSGLKDLGTLLEDERRWMGDKDLHLMLA
jgi:hypothetical protein